MTAAFTLSSCAVKINDYEFCSPLPNSLGAVCDNFLTANQKILSEEEWQAKQADWIAAGEAVECTQSKTIGDIKGEIEKLCSVSRCHYETKRAIIDGLSKIQALGKDLHAETFIHKLSTEKSIVP